jgi:hypothetical protein
LGHKVKVKLTANVILVKRKGRSRNFVLCRLISARINLTRKRRYRAGLPDGGDLVLHIEHIRVERVRHKAITPYLLDRVNTLSGARSKKANIALLLNNARVGAQIACAL